MSITIKEEFKNAFNSGRIIDEKLLEQSILEDGCRDDLIVWAKSGEQILLDGHHRYKYCKKHDIPFGIIEKKFNSEYKAKEWIFFNQFARNNFTKKGRKYARGQLYNESKKAVSNKKGKNQHSEEVKGQNVPQPNTAEAIAEEENVSDRTVKRDAKYSESVNEIDKNVPGAKNELLSGKVTLSDKDTNEIARQEPQKQEKIFDSISSGEVKDYKEYKKKQKKEKLEQKKREIKQQEKKEIAYTPIAYDQSYEEYLIDTDKRFDLLLTDPPFSTDIDNISEFVNSWLPLSLNTLTDTTRGYICIGAYPEEIEAYFNYFNNQDRFIIDSPLVWTYRNTLGRTPNRKYNLNYQLILHFYTKDSEDLDTSITNEMFSVQDINAPDGRQGDRFHKWQKPNKLAQRLIRHSTREGDQIIDPFCGSGTFLVNAGKLNRYAFGCDIDKEALKICEERGCNVQW